MTTIKQYEIIGTTEDKPLEFDGHTFYEADGCQWDYFGGLCGSDGCPQESDYDIICIATTHTVDMTADEWRESEAEYLI